MRHTQQLLTLTTVTVLLLAAACSRKGAEPVVADDEPAGSDTAMPSSAAPLPRTASADGASVFFITPADGDTVSNPVVVEFGLDGMNLVKSGDDQPQSGHHHLLIDAELPDLSLPIPSDPNHVHFGDASASTELTLAPGEHSLRLLLGDHLHIPHDPPLMSESITITVQ